METVEDRASAAGMRAILETVDRLTDIVERLHEMRAVEWMDSEQAAAHVGAKSPEAFEKIALKEGIPRHKLSQRLILYNRDELDQWLMDR